MATVESLLTAEEYMDLPNPGFLTELIHGEIVAVNMPRFNHGVICARVAYLLSSYVIEQDLGWVLTNDSGVVTRRNPDTVRGADVAFYSYASVPKDQPPEKYSAKPPELVFEVKSRDDRWPHIQEKVGEYLSAGVQLVGVLDPESATLAVYHAERPVEALVAEDEFTAPAILGDFRVAVSSFFD